MNDKINFIIGSGGHTRVVVDAANLQNIKIYKIIDINKTAKKNEKILNVPVTNNFNEIKKFKKENVSLFISIGDCKERKQYFDLYNNKKYSFFNVIHPLSKISKTSIIGKSIFINSNAVLNSLVKIRDNSIINTSAIIEHESIINKNCHVGPGSIICGRSKVKENVFVGAGCVILPNITIGKNSIIGAGSVVTKNASPNSILIGSPAKKFKN